MLHFGMHSPELDVIGTVNNRHAQDNQQTGKGKGEEKVRGAAIRDVGS